MNSKNFITFILSEWNQLAFKRVCVIVKDIEKRQRNTFDLTWRLSFSAAELFTKLGNDIYLETERHNGSCTIIKAEMSPSDSRRWFAAGDEYQL